MNSCRQFRHGAAKTDNDQHMDNSERLSLLQSCSRLVFESACDDVRPMSGRDSGK